MSERSGLLRVELDGEVFVALCADLATPATSLELPQLTEAERAVAGLVVDGLSNGAIARARGVALRTVANQLAAIFRKLRVDSRVGLVALLSRSSPMLPTRR